MTLYYSLVFALLMFEMAVFVTIIIPLPLKIKRTVFTFISENPLIAKLQYGLKITFIFILILFIDSVNRVYRVQVELASAKNNQAAQVVAGSERMEVQARKFYSQRNMYLCGFTLFLSLILNRTYVMILDTLRLEEKLRSYEEGTGGKTSSGLGEAGNAGEIAGYKKEIKKLQQDNETLKKQAQGLSNEYNRLGDQVSTPDSVPKKDR